MVGVDFLEVNHWSIKRFIESMVYKHDLMLNWKKYNKENLVFFFFGKFKLISKRKIPKFYELFSKICKLILRKQ